MFGNSTIRKFISITGYDISKVIDLYLDFTANYYEGVVSYYKGFVDVLDPNSIRVFSALKTEVEVFEGVLMNNYNSFDSFDLFELCEFVEQIYIKTKVINKISKFLRSSRTYVHYSSNVGVEYTMEDGDTFEKISSKDDADPNNNWVELAIKNQVFETDYKAREGGLNLTINKKGSQNIFLNSVVDNLYGDRLYGLDMSEQFIYEDGDYLVDTYRETFKKSVLRLSSLKKGDIPEFPKLGLQRDILGSNLGTLMLPFITRQLKEAMSVDDTIVEFSVQDIIIKGGMVYLEFTARSFYDFIYNQTIEL